MCYSRVCCCMGPLALIMNAESVIMCYSRVCCCMGPLALIMNAESVLMCYSRVCCCMAPLVRARPCWPGQWPTTQTAPSSGSLAVSWCRSTLGRAAAWSESSLSWPGDIHDFLIDLYPLCVCVCACVRKKRKKKNIVSFTAVLGLTAAVTVNFKSWLHTVQPSARQQ